MSNPAALPALALLAGACTGALISFPPKQGLGLLVCSWAVAIVLFAVRVDKGVHIAATVGFILAGAIAARGERLGSLGSPLRHVFVTELEPAWHTTPARVEAVPIEGVLLEDASRTPYGAGLDFRVERIALNGRWVQTAGRVRLSVAGALVGEQIDIWRAGRRLRMPATMRRPAPYLNPGVADQDRALADRGVVLLGSVKSGALVEVVDRGPPASEGGGAVRAYVRATLSRHVGQWDARSAGLATAILIGDRAGLGPELEERLREAGTYHVIAISGGNIAVLAACVVMLMRMTRASPRAAAATTIGVVLAYGGLVTGGQSVTRASSAATIFFAARVFDLRTPVLNLLLVSAMLALVWIPLSVLDAGFALTFGATAGIVCGAGRVQMGLERMLERCGAPGGRVRRLRPASALLAATVAAELALFPVGLWWFSQVTTAGLVLNFVAIPLMAVVQLGAAATCLLMPLGWLASLSGLVTHLAAAGLVESTRLLDWAPWLAWRVPPPPILIVSVYYGAAIVMLVATSRLLRRTAASLAIASGVSMLSAPPTLALGRALTDWSVGHDKASGWTQRDSTLRLAFLDVGQGDSTLVRFPGGYSLLVDAGGASGSFDIGTRVLGPALWALGIDRLDSLLVTHGHPDHIGGAHAMIEDFRPREIWDGLPVPPYEPLQVLARQATAAGVIWRPRLAGDFLRTGGVAVRVLHPRPADWERQDVRNDDSVVLELRLGDVAIVLAGDIGREIERGILDRFSPASVRIVKAPHHGSRSSSSPELLEALQPAAVVFSCGRGNLYGHPAPDVSARYEAAGASIFRTDRDGAILLETDGERVWMEGMRGKRTVF